MIRAAHAAVGASQAQADLMPACPPPPADAYLVADELYDIWTAVMAHLGELSRWWEIVHRVDGIRVTPELMAGADEPPCRSSDMPPIPPCTCWYGRRYVVVDGHAAFIYCFRTSPTCWHHGDGFRW